MLGIIVCIRSTLYFCFKSLTIRLASSFSTFFI
nr:MAG TPA: hypothetical protein [Caudoviricetes sp.]